MMDFNKIDIRNLNAKAQRFFEESDQGALTELFGKCETFEAIDDIAEELYDDFFSEEE